MNPGPKIVKASVNDRLVRKPNSLPSSEASSSCSRAAMYRGSAASWTHEGQGLGNGGGSCSACPLVYPASSTAMNSCICPKKPRTTWNRGFEVGPRLDNSGNPYSSVGLQAFPASVTATDGGIWPNKPRSTFDQGFVKGPRLDNGGDRFFSVGPQAFPASSADMDVNCMPVKPKATANDRLMRRPCSPASAFDSSMPSKATVFGGSAASGTSGGFEGPGLDNRDSSFSMGSQASGVINTPAKSPSKGECICYRPIKLVVCPVCGSRFEGRTRLECPVHPKVSFLTDVAECPAFNGRCLSRNLMEFATYAQIAAD